MDPLSDVLSLLKPRAYVTGALSAGDPWSLQLPAYAGIKCYMVVAGTCWLAMEGEPPAALHEGDCLLLPHGKPFVIASDLDLPPVDARIVVSGTTRYNGVLAVTPGEDFLLLGTHFDLEGDAGFLLEVLPLIVLFTGDQQCASMRWAVERLLSEMREPQVGGALVAQQVAYTLLIDALRQYQEQSDHRPGWFAALAEPQIRAALACMHERPAHPWTLEELARAAGLSRTALVQAFRKVVGETPIAYLTRWRMTLAAHKLSDRKQSLTSVALQVGYQSQSAFCAAFKRYSGVSPMRFVATNKITSPDNETRLRQLTGSRDPAGV